MDKLTCSHCLLRFPASDAVIVEHDGNRHVFCCNGCKGIFLLIKNEGLDDFYNRRRWDAPGRPAEVLKEPDTAAFLEDARDVDGEKEIDIFIDGIRCASCVWLNEKFISKAKGVSSVRINFATHRAKIRWNPSAIDLQSILRRIQAIGYEPKPYRESELFIARKAENRDLLVRFGTAAFLSSQLMIYSAALYAGYFQGIDSRIKIIFEIIAMFLTFPVIMYSGMPFIRGTISGLRHMHFTMDSLISLGSISAFIYSIYQMVIGGTVYFDTSAMIITLILLGRYIESTAKGKASEAINKLSELSPKEARRVLQSSASEEITTCDTVLINISELRSGDIVKVLPGEKIPSDGVVLYGESEVDESILTGESRPISKRPGSQVIGGSINLFGSIFLRITKTGKDTILAGIIKAVEDAQATKPKLQVLADRIVGYFVPAIIIISALTTAYHILTAAPVDMAVMNGISVLVIACPCSLGLATPLAVLIFTTKASSRGILVKAGEVIENASKIDHVVLDKTGTITEGKPSLKKMIILDKKLEESYILKIAASIENLSEHSIGKAISDAWKHNRNNVTEFKAVPGRGIMGRIYNTWYFIGNLSFMEENTISTLPDGSSLVSLKELTEPFESSGDTVIYLGWDNIVRALFVVSDCIREEAVDAINKIGQIAGNIVIISGDNITTTSAISCATGINNAIAGMSPEGKRDFVRKLQSKGNKVLMVGDGINDAPALAEASVGIAMGRGTDIAMESSDSVLIRNDLTAIPYFMRLASKTYDIIKQNIFWAFFYNLVAIPLAVSGALHPIIAAAAMAASSLFVVVNSLRIREKVKF